MLTELPIDRISEYADRFPGAQAQMVVASIAAGNTEGQLWASPDDLLLLWDKGNIVFYLAGTAEADSVSDDLAALMTGVVWPRAAEEGLRYFRVCVLSPHLASVLPDVFQGAALHSVKKRFYAFHQAHVNNVPLPSLTGVAFLPIDIALLNRSDLANVQRVEDEVRWMWSEMGRFDERGFGVAARLGDQLICWCTAEYVSRTRCGVGIETAEEYRRQGVATAAAARFVAESLRRSIRPHWECDVNNPASARVAEKVGFTQVEEWAVWAGRFPHG